jgi:hypothetical protein
MKTQLSKPARNKASYTDQYKQEALEFWRSSGRSAANGESEKGIGRRVVARSRRPAGAARDRMKRRGSKRSQRTEVTGQIKSSR